jgi:hypothetical protein
VVLCIPAACSLQIDACIVVTSVDRQGAEASDTALMANTPSLEWQAVYHGWVLGCTCKYHMAGCTYSQVHCMWLSALLNLTVQVLCDSSPSCRLHCQHFFDISAGAGLLHSCSPSTAAYPKCTRTAPPHCSALQHDSPSHFHNSSRTPALMHRPRTQQLQTRCFPH